MKRLPGLLVVLVLVLAGVSIGAVLVLDRKSSSAEHNTQADADAAIIPLSDMSTGTAQSNPVDLHISCTSRPFDKTVAIAQATYRPPDGPSVGEAVDIYPRGSAQQIMTNVRAQWSCPTAHDSTRNTDWSVATLAFPSLVKDQTAYQVSTQEPNTFSTFTIDIITMRVNTSALLVVTSGSSFGAPDIKGTEAFARRALSRAKEKLGGST